MTINNIEFEDSYGDKKSLVVKSPMALLPFIGAAYCALKGEKTSEEKEYLDTTLKVVTPLIIAAVSLGVVAYDNRRDKHVEMSSFLAGLSAVMSSVVSATKPEPSNDSDKVSLAKAALCSGVMLAILPAYGFGVLAVQVTSDEAKNAAVAGVVHSAGALAFTAAGASFASEGKTGPAVANFAAAGVYAACAARSFKKSYESYAQIALETSKHTSAKR